MKFLIYLFIATIHGSSKCDADVRGPPLENVFCGQQCPSEPDCDLKYLSHKMNVELLWMNRLSAKLEWDASTRPSRYIFSLKERFSLIRNNWKNAICSDDPRDDQLPLFRMVHLFCRGPLYSSDQLRSLMTVLDKLVTNYATRKICRTEIEGLKCYHGEPDLKMLMSTSRVTIPGELPIVRIEAIIKGYYQSRVRKKRMPLKLDEVSHLCLMTCGRQELSFNFSPGRALQNNFGST